MSNETVIIAKNVYKKFPLSLKRSLAYGTLDILKNFMGIKVKTQKLRKGEFWAVKDVSFELKKGEILGIVGENGSGKSTLLRMLTGIYPPDNGSIEVRGKVGALIAVGAGFNPNMSGKENIYLNGTILGMTNSEINKKFDSIVKFAEIGDFINSPVSNYSSGMRVRLGFSIAVHTEVPILLMDEVLAVGDVGFQLKCFNKLGELRENGISTILVTHNMHQISSFCNRLLVLNKGEVAHYGETEKGIGVYNDLFGSQVENTGEIVKAQNGTEKFEILNVKFTPEIIDNKIKLTKNQPIEINIDFDAKEDIGEVDLDIVCRLPVQYIKDFYQATNKTISQKLIIPKGRGNLRIEVPDFELKDIQMHIFVAIWCNNKKKLLMWWRNIPVDMPKNPAMTGWSNKQLKVELKKI